jgi:hypothetical protein
VSGAAVKAMNESACPICDSDDTTCLNMEFGTYHCNTCGEFYDEDELVSNRDRSSANKTRPERERDEEY